jgi:hypothetical protein
MSKYKTLRWVCTVCIIAVLFVTGCEIQPFTPSITLAPITNPTTSPSTTASSKPTGTTSVTSTPTTTAKPKPTTPAYPTTEVDIYTKGPPWEYKNPADNVMNPNVLGFAWNLDSDHTIIDSAHNHGATFISEVSLWNHDGWEEVGDLDFSMANAYNTGWNGEPLYIQGMVFLNVNHPAFQQWLSDFIKQQITQGADGFVFDETGGNSEAIAQGGAVDEYSLQGFGEYLAAKYTKQELEAQGIYSTANFNYKEYLSNQGLSAQYQRGDIWNINFGPDYLDFQQQKTSDLIIKLAAEARSYASSKGKKIVITANADPIYGIPSRAFYSVLDYFTFEHAWTSDHWRARDGYKEFPSGQSSAPKIKYTVSNGQKAVVLESINEYGEFMKLGVRGGTSRILHDFAEVYANLGFYCYFDLDTAFMGMQFIADHARLRPYYQFLRDHPEVFNDLTFSPDVAVMLPPLAVWNDMGPIDSAQGVAYVLSESNIPYDVIDINHDLNYKVVVANGYAWSDAQLNKLLDYARAGGTVIAIDSRFGRYDENYQEVSRPELEALKTDGIYTLGKGSFIFFSDYIGWKYWANMDQAAFNQIKETIAPYSEPNVAPAGVQLLPYISGNNMVVHILNYNYKNNDFVTQKSLLFSIRLPEGVTAMNKTLTLLSPDGNVNLNVPYTADDGWLKFSIPELYIWSVVVLK